MGLMSDQEQPKNGTPLHTKILYGMLVGAALGLAANYIGSRMLIPLDRPADAPPMTADERAAYQTMGPWYRLDENQNGLADGVDFLAGDVADPLGRVFLRLILMVVVPLVVSALALGVYGIGDVRKLGRIGVKTLGLTAVLSGLAVLIGVTLVNVFEPGKSLPAEQRQRLQAQYAKESSAGVEKAKNAKKLKDILLDMIPENPLQEMVGAVDGSSKGNGMLAVMFFSLAVGVSLASLPVEKAAPLVGLLESLFDVAMVVIGFAMKLAPYAVACLVFALVSRLGFDVLLTLGWFVATVILGLSLQLFVSYSVLVYFLGGMKPRQFFSGVKEAMLTAFGTSSSNATLPTAMRVAEENLKLPTRIARFVLTVGATGNQNGTALYEGVVVLFLAQVFGVELTIAQQVQVVLMSVLAGVGTAGVPGGSIPMIVIVMQSVGVPPAGIGIILGVDRFLDMCRTVLNVTGDLALATCVAYGEPPDSPSVEEPMVAEVPAAEAGAKGAESSPAS
jgi:DAACS family dicarboxylate/amino acid:cation (Na+ or H+) symporter